MSGLRSGQVAAAAGVNPQTLRYYERRGLLAEPDRSLGGHRLYPAETVTVVIAGTLHAAVKAGCDDLVECAGQPCCPIPFATIAPGGTCRPGHRHDRGPWAHRYGPRMTVVRSILLFVVAALFEIGGAWLIWQGWREHRGLWWIAAGVIALGAYGFVATFQPDPNFGRILAAYGGVFVAGSLAWGVIVDKFRPDRWDLIGAGICLIGVALIMYAPRSAGGS